MRIALGNDHAGYPLKATVLQLLKSWGHTVKDCGSFNPDPVDFPDIVALVSAELKAGRADRGVLVCGTGIGAAMAANKTHGIRAALCHDSYSARQCVEHDDANVVAFGAQIIGPTIAEEVLRGFLSAKFSTEEQFRRRVKKLNALDNVPPGK